MILEEICVIMKIARHAELIAEMLSLDSRTHQQSHFCNSSTMQHLTRQAWASSGIQRNLGPFIYIILMYAIYRIDTVCALTTV